MVDGWRPQNFPAQAQSFPRAKPGGKYLWAFMRNLFRKTYIRDSSILFIAWNWTNFVVLATLLNYTWEGHGWKISVCHSWRILLLVFFILLLSVTLSFMLWNSVFFLGYFKVKSYFNPKCWALLSSLNMKYTIITLSTK